MKSSAFIIPLSLMVLISTIGCKSSMFTSTAANPHAKYAESLKKADLDSTALGRAWLLAATRSLNAPLTITIPFRETGYFDAVRTSAVGYRFQLKRGELVRVSLTKKSASSFNIFMELWRVNESSAPSLEEAVDEGVLVLNKEIKKDGSYILRLQPELLSSGEYTIVIQTTPSLAFPVIEKANPKISSLWGAARDGGARSHEGIDIFAPKRTPLVAAAEGIVSSVRENELGGKVIFIRAKDRGYSLYYAHLDSQMVQPGQKVNEGDVIGLMGNSGNARTTAPHLHFGIYTSDGAVDPLPFVQKKTITVPDITVSTSNLNQYIRFTQSATVLNSLEKNATLNKKINSSTIAKVDGATGNYYRINLPDGSFGYVAGAHTVGTDKPIETLTIKKEVALVDQPYSNGATKLVLKQGDKAQVLGLFNTYNLVRVGDTTGWMLQ